MAEVDERVSPITEAEEAKFRESVRLIGDAEGDWWSNRTAERLLATIDRERARLARDRAELAAAVREVRTRHQRGDYTDEGWRSNSVDGRECVADGEDWPCTAERLAALIEGEKGADHAD